MTFSLVEMMNYLTNHEFHYGHFFVCAINENNHFGLPGLILLLLLLLLFVNEFLSEIMKVETNKEKNMKPIY